MRLGVIPENPIERLVLAAGLVPRPIIETQLAFTQARAVMAGVELGLFEALKDEARTVEELARVRGTHPRATEALLNCLVGCDYLAYEDTTRRYSLRPVSRKWLLLDSPHSLANKLRFQLLEWRYLDQLESFVRDGKPIELHSSNSAAEWRSYQAGMVDVGRLSLGEVVARTPVPKGARRMLDIGGSGGTYSAAFLRKYPGLRATILDLEAAVQHARPFVEAHQLGERLELIAGNVLTDDLGEGTYDFVFMSSVAHHFTREQNGEVARKVFRALVPGGVFILQDFERGKRPSPKNQSGALMDLYFALTSASGTWALDEMRDWLRQAGFTPRRSVKFRAAPGMVQAVGVKA
ncbi:class I SAM-dependent methyltransferase [Archangium sp.]|jgi:SAM-dependent methyltransferase|uniref:class I SAM-dependent methyltransferase n=1 Tax=Archangium sp. TaxID=1872627 RepID=UPI002ED94839